MSGNEDPGSARLLIRFMLLVMVMAAPIVAMMLHVHATQSTDRDAAARVEALQNAGRIEADLAGLVEAGRQLAAAIALADSVRDQLPQCGTYLNAVRTSLPGYASMTIFGEDGATICTTLTQPADLARLRNTALIRQSLQNSSFAVGGFTPTNAGRDAVLPIALPYIARDGLRRGVIMLAFNLEWLHQQLAEREIAPGATAGIADSNGTTLIRFPRERGMSYVGKTMPPAVLPYVRASRRGTADLIGYDGQSGLAAYVPAGETNGDMPNRTGLFITYASPRPAGRGIFGNDIAEIAAAVALSLVLGLLVGHVTFVRPVRNLLDAARAWSRDDFTTRAPMSRVPAFSVLARALNHMAETLARDRRSLRELNLTLETRVQERTHDVIEGRNRLEQEIAERLRIEAELRRAQKLQVVGQLAGGIAHHFNNLLTAIIGSLDLLRRRAQADGVAPADAQVINPTDTRAINLIDNRAINLIDNRAINLIDNRAINLIDGALQAADRGRRLTSQLLIFSRAQRMLPRSVDINAAILQLSDLLVGTLGRGIRIDLDLAPSDGPGMGPVMVDPGQLEVALVNLAINARDAMERDGDARGVLTIGTSAVRLPEELPLGPATSAGFYIAIEMRDTGAGIAPDLLSRVFEPFFSTKPADQASGLGLSQVQSLAVQSGGDVRIESRAGQGTKVLLLLPRVDQRLPDEPAPVMAIAAPSANLRVLLVDDDRLVGDVIAEILTERGHRVTVATDPGEAVTVLAEDHASGGPGYDLLLTDYVMPGMTGLALIAAARRIRPAQKALLMTGHASFHPGDTILADDVIRKPFTMAELLEVIDRRGAAQSMSTHST